MSLGIPVGTGIVLVVIGDDGPERLLDVVFEGVLEMELDEEISGGCGIGEISGLLVLSSRECKPNARKVSPITMITKIHNNFRLM